MAAHDDEAAAAPGGVAGADVNGVTGAHAREQATHAPAGGGGAPPPSKGMPVETLDQGVEGSASPSVATRGDVGADGRARQPGGGDPPPRSAGAGANGGGEAAAAASRSAVTTAEAGPDKLGAAAEAAAATASRRPPTRGGKGKRVNRAGSGAVTVVNGVKLCQAACHKCSARVVLPKDPLPEGVEQEGPVVAKRCPKCMCAYHVRDCGRRYCNAELEVDPALCPRCTGSCSCMGGPVVCSASVSRLKMRMRRNKLPQTAGISATETAKRILHEHAKQQKMQNKKRRMSSVASDDNAAKALAMMGAGSGATVRAAAAVSRGARGGLGTKETAAAMEAAAFAAAKPPGTMSVYKTAPLVAAAAAGLSTTQAAWNQTQQQMATTQQTLQQVQQMQQMIALGSLGMAGGVGGMAGGIGSIGMLAEQAMQTNNPMLQQHITAMMQSEADAINARARAALLRQQVKIQLAGVMANNGGGGAVGNSAMQAFVSNSAAMAGLGNGMAGLGGLAGLGNGVAGLGNGVAGLGNGVAGLGNGIASSAALAAAAGTLAANGSAPTPAMPQLLAQQQQQAAATAGLLTSPSPPAPTPMQAPPAIP